MPSPVISIAQMRDWEKATWATGQTEAEVIRRVGKAVGEYALGLTKPGELIVIVAGKGNNGQDARCARECLPERRVDLLEVRDPAMDFSKMETLLSLKPALVIDGLFGIGVNRPLNADWIRFIEKINASKARVLAVDVPSGLDADSGEPQGAAIRAAVTLAVGTPKTGLLAQSAWPFVGRLEVAREVGLIPCPHASEVKWTLSEDFIGYPPRREEATHKGSYGHLAILAGSLGYHGAAVLTARGAQRARPGLITLHTLESVYAVVAGQLQAVMVSPWECGVELNKPSEVQARPLTPSLSPSDGEKVTSGLAQSLLAPRIASRYSGLLAGPGLAASTIPEELKMLTKKLWRESPLPMVVDASALAWLPPGAVPDKAIRVITPHPGEAARLLDCTSSDVQANRVSAMRALAKKYGNTWVVLKGHQTVVGRSEGAIFVNCSGNPYLAQGGSGDVLSGFLAGLLAQPILQPDPLMAIRFAVWQHGAAADRLQSRRRNWVVEELAGELG